MLDTIDAFKARLIQVAVVDEPLRPDIETSGKEWWRKALPPDLGIQQL